MLNKIINYLARISDGGEQVALSAIFQNTTSRHSTQAVSSAGLVIKAGASTLAKTGAAATVLTVNGRIVRIAAATDQPALTGLTVPNAAFNVAVFFVDGAGVGSVAFGVAAASIGGVTFPDFPLAKTLVGFLIINPTGTGSFVGGTTALDDATVVPNVVYVSPTGAFDPTLVFA